MPIDEIDGPGPQTPRDRRILHIDMDAFFASVEQVRNPALRGKPLIIGGSKTDIRGVVCTASYEARKFGIHSGMPLIQAKKRCPEAICIRGHFEHYQEASRQIRSILDTLSPLVEMASIDEAYVDISGSQRLFGGDDAIADYVKNRIRTETQLPCTVAISPNKLVSKIASDEAKPDGYLRIDAGEEAGFLHPLALGKLPGIGPRTREILESLGILTIGQLAELPLPPLLAAFGPGGYALQRAAQGLSYSEVVPERRPKSISRETTFPQDLLDWNQIERILVYLAERAAYALRENGMESKCITLKVRYGDFQTSTFARTLAEPTCIDNEIVQVLQELLPQARKRRARVRLIGVALTSLSHNQHQLHLFGGKKAEKWERVLEGVDAIRRRHGFEFIRLGKSAALGEKVELSTPSLSR